MTGRTLVVLGIALGIFVSALDTTIVGTAMPTVIASLGGTELYTWVFAVYMLASTTSTPIFGKLSDLFGQKVLFALGMGLFLLGSVLCGSAQTMMELIAFRTIQGIGGGALMALAFTIIGHVFSAVERPKMMGIMSAVWAISAIIGPVTGGFIIDHLSWRWTFYVNVPIGIVAAALILANLKDVRHRDERPVVDFVGAILLSGSIVSLLFALLQGGAEGWTSTDVLGLFALSAILLLIFVWHESRSPEPIVPLELFRLRAFTVCNLENLIAGAALLGMTGFIPLYVQGVLGGSATTAGMALTPVSVGWPLGSVTGGHLVNRLGYRTMAIIAMGFMMIGFYLLTGMTTDGTPTSVGVNMFVVGLGMGLLTPTVTSAVQNAVPRNHMGVASSSVAFYRNIGGTVGVSVMGAVLNNQMSVWTSRLVDSNLVHNLSSIMDINLLDPQVLLKPELSGQLPQAVMSAMVQSLSNSLHTVFVVSFSMLAVGLAVSLLVPDSTPVRDMEKMVSE